MLDCFFVCFSFNCCLWLVSSVLIWWCFLSNVFILLLWSVWFCFKFIGVRFVCVVLLVWNVVNGLVGVGWFICWIFRIIVVVIEVVIVNWLDWCINGIILFIFGMDCYFDLGVKIVVLFFSVVVIWVVMLNFGIIVVFLWRLLWIIW